MTDITLKRSWKFHLERGSAGPMPIFIPLDRIVGIVEGYGYTHIHVEGKTDPFRITEDADFVRDIVDSYNIFREKQ